MKLCVAATPALGSMAETTTVALLREFAVQVTVAVIVVDDPWVTGFGLAVALDVKVGGVAVGVAATSAEFGLEPTELDADTT